MNPELARLAELTAKLKENLILCARPEGAGAKNHEPGVNAIHDVRTGTRRIEAVLESIQRSMPGNASRVSSEMENAGDAMARWQRLLKKIRRSAGAVRDLDVHRSILADLLKNLPTRVDDDQETREAHAAQGSDAPPGLKHSPEGTAEHHPTPLQKQAEDLDAWLRHIRHEHAQPLVAGAEKWANKLEGHLAALTETVQSQPIRQARAASPAATALDAFARLSHEMQQLYADNLHDFRKGAKKARYMAETAKGDEHAGAVGKALKKLQDEIGDWHDWLVLAEEAHRALGDHGVELVAHIEHARDKHYALALKTAERIRGRLMGEWQATRLRTIRRTRRV